MVTARDDSYQVRHDQADKSDDADGGDRDCGRERGYRKNCQAKARDWQPENCSLKITTRKDVEMTRRSQTSHGNCREKPQ